MVFKTLDTGILASNCYILGNNGEGIIIDPGAKAKDILEAVSNEKLKIKYIILTHAHIDHIVSMEEVRQKLNAKVLIHEGDAKGLSDPARNGAGLFGSKITFNDADETLRDGDVLEAGGLKFEIMHTPGHSPGSICIKAGSNIFTGDTLFRMSVGRTDFDYGDSSQLAESLYKLAKLDDEINIYPGHGVPSTIGFEKENNPFM